MPVIRDRPADAALFARLLTAGEAGTIAFPPGRYLIEQSFEIDPGVALWFAEGAILEVRGSIRTRGALFSGRHQIFDVLAQDDGDVSSNVEIVATNGRPQVPEVLPIWWGAGLDDTEGIALRAMGQSLGEAGRVVVTFDAVRHVTFPFTITAGSYLRSRSPGQRPELVARLANAPLLTVAGPPSELTMVEGIDFHGLSARTEFGRSVTEDLIVVEPGLQADLNIVDCGFYNAAGAGVHVGAGTTVQLHGVSSVGCAQGAVSITDSRTTPPNRGDRSARAIVQWSESSEDAQHGSIVAAAPQLPVHVQASRLSLQDGIDLAVGEDSRIILADGDSRGVFSVRGQAQLLAVKFDITSSRLRADGGCGARLDSLDMAVFHDGAIRLDGSSLLQELEEKPPVLRDLSGRLGNHQSILGTAGRASTPLDRTPFPSLDHLTEVRRCAVLHVSNSLGPTRIHLDDVRLEPVEGPDFARDVTGVLLTGVSHETRLVASRLSMSGGHLLGIDGRANAVFLEPSRLPDEFARLGSGPTPALLVLQGPPSAYGMISGDPDGVRVSFRPNGSLERRDTPATGPSSLEVEGGRWSIIDPVLASNVLAGRFPLPGYWGDIAAWFDQEGFHAMVCLRSDPVEADWTATRLRRKACGLGVRA